ncbi:MAG: hypothetical protein RIQ33_88 [Bacteroidota bacterium]|jgi:hypothetical protein
MKTNQPKKKLYNLPKNRGIHENLKLLRVITAVDCVKIDFGYFATDYFDKGGWIRISNNTFLRDTSTKNIYKLINAENIPIAPQVHNFNSTNEWKYFSLVFEPLPTTTNQFDLIEEEPGDKNSFNFKRIVLDNSTALELVN